MSNDYSHMDAWTHEMVTQFKEEGKERQLKQIEVTAGVLSVLSENSTIVSEGDSWFDYRPGTDLIDCLRKHHGYYIENYAKAGDTLENMIYGTGIDDDFQRTTPSIELVLRKIAQLKPKVFLFSGGGNDIAGNEFASYLNHHGSGLPLLRHDYIDDTMSVVFKEYFSDLIKKVAAVSPQTHIVAHGYGHTVPTGKGVRFWGFNFSGPWLKPALAMKGIFDPALQRGAVETLINAYNAMLKELDRLETFHHVDLRDQIDPDADWADELHLKNSAYAAAADAIHQKIVEIQG